MKRGGSGAKKKGKGIAKMTGTQVHGEDDQEKANSLVDVIEACERFIGGENESVHRAYMDCIKQFYTTAELHNYRRRYVFEGPEDNAFKKCVERFEKMAKGDKNNEVFKSYKRISVLKAKERVEEQKKTMAEEQKKTMAEEQKKTMAAVVEANDDSQIQKQARDLIEKRDWEGAFSLVLHARSFSLAPWIMEEASGDVSQLGLSQLVLISLFQQLCGGIWHDKNQARLKFMENVVSCFDTLSWSSFHRGMVVGVLGVLEGVKDQLEECKRLDMGGEVLLEAIKALHF